ncbi:MAG: hypothetical protein QME94_17225 [Anaerolineae bacterium]|nr:hypothetical protein [Anaerolineae bacterium]
MGQGRSAPPTQRGRLRLRLRGLDFVEREAAGVPAASLRRIDTALAMGRGMGNVDPVRTSVFHAQSVLMALELGEPTRVLDCLSGEVMLSACGGVPTRPRTRSLIARMRAISERLEPRSDERELRLLRGRIAACLGFALHLSGDHRSGLVHLDEAADLLSTCIGRAWNVANAQLYALDALARLGEVAELSRRVAVQLRLAAERGNRLVRASTCTWAGVLSWLAADRPKELSVEIEEIMEHWSKEGVHLQHLWALSAKTQIDLYRGQAERACEELESRWRDLFRLPLTRVQLLRIDAHCLRGRIHLGVEPCKSDPGAVEGSARALEREGVAAAIAQAALLRAGALGKNDPARAVRLLRQAELGFFACELRLHHQVTRFRRGELMGGETGRSLIEEATRFLAAEGVVNASRIVSFIAPGRW